MVSGPSPISAFTPAPTVRFRPDPGEPAATLSAREQQTALLVSNQEQRNETRLRAQAVARGEDVLFSNRTFTIGVGDQSPVFNGGLTTVQTRTDSNGFVPDTILAPEDEEEESQLRVGEEDEEEPAAAFQDALANSTEPSEEELESEEQALDNEEARLERNLTRATLEQEEALQENDPVQFEQARREEQQLEREQEEIEDEQREVELERLEEQLEELVTATGGAIEDSANAALGIVGVLFGTNQDGDTSPDRSVNIGGPGFYARAPRI